MTNSQAINNKNKYQTIGFVLVILMILLQGFYGIFAYIDASAFSNVRGTELFNLLDADWVKIYGSRTIFIALVLAYLLWTKHYQALMWCAAFGTVMPITDAALALEAGAPMKVVIKHVLTIGYLLITFAVLKRAVTLSNESAKLNN